MAGSGLDDSSAVEVVASQVRPVTLWKWQLGIWVLLLGGWGWQAIEQPTALRILMAALAGLSVVMYAWMLLSATKVQLLLAGESLHLKRPLRPLALARSDILEVVGDVPNRPTWSQKVIITTRAGTVKLPALDRPPAEIIARLHEWAGVREDPDFDRESPRSE